MTPQEFANALAIWRCIHCERITILRNNNPQQRCECGCDFYPMSRRVIEGKAMTVDEVAGEPLGGIWVLYKESE